MTPTEHRMKCLEAMYVACLKAMYVALVKKGVLVVPPSVLYPAVTAAFDALRSANARVVPVEATERMLGALDERWFVGPLSQSDILEMFDIMAAAGDLTNATEKKK